MKIKYFAQALKFACMPTLSVLVLLFFGFFDLGKTINFISSDIVGAILLRVLLVIAEIVLVWIMYIKYMKEDIRNNAVKKETYESLARHASLNNIRNWNNDLHNTLEYKVYNTDSVDMVVVERISNGPQL